MGGAVLLVMYKLIRCSDMGDHDVIASSNDRESLENRAERANQKIEQQGFEGYCWYVVV